MSAAVERLRPCDAPEALDFLNMVFSMARVPHDFSEMLPKMWENDGESMTRHFAIREDGRIRALVGAYPLPITIAGDRLLFSTMGNVATHPHCSGKGYMNRLVQTAMQELRDIGVDAIRLGGLRQRYARFGFEPAGMQYHFSLTAHNLERYYKGTFSSGIRFEPLRAEDAKSVSWAKSLHETGGVWVDRLHNTGFYDSLTAWRNQPFLALRDGKCVGYLTAGADRTGVSEFRALTVELEVELLCAWLSQNRLTHVAFTVEPWQTALSRLLQPLCEGWSISSPSHFCIMRWDRVVNALLRLKAEIAPLLPGEVRLEIQGWGTLRLCVDADGAHCKRTDDSTDFSLTPAEAARLFFGPLPPVSTCSLGNSHAAALLQAWLPLPLGWNTLDRV